MRIKMTKTVEIKFVKDMVKNYSIEIIVYW